MVKSIDAVLITLMTALIASTTTTAAAATPYEVTLTCPVGGQSFAFTRTGSYSNWGSRPDGKPYGSWIAPLPIPVCPDNGLVMYKDFSPDEIKRLEPLVMSPAYGALRNEAPYYRAVWLMRALHDGDAMDQLWMIAQAAWESDDAPERKQRYQREFAEGVAALPKQPEDFGWISMQGRAVNAWRELGAFARARAVLDELPLDSLDVPAKPDDKEAAQKRALLSYIKQLGTLIDGRDGASEPLRMIPAQVAAQKCMEMEKAESGRTDAYCNEAPIRKAMEATPSAE